MRILNEKATESARKRYDRNSIIYDFLEQFAEKWRFGTWRRLLWSKVKGQNVLEVGVGTGKNFPFYPTGKSITAIDFSEKMLARAREKAEKQQLRIRLIRMDVQQLEFTDNSFDTVIGSFVFCSVPDPVLGLKEIERVLKPGGQLLLLEHVLAKNRVIAWIMNFINTVVVRMMGANINRRTVENVSKAGLVVEKVTDLGAIFKLIEARKAR